MCAHSCALILANSDLAVPANGLAERNNSGNQDGDESSCELGHSFGTMRAEGAQFLRVLYVIDRAARNKLLSVDGSNFSPTVRERRIERIADTLTNGPSVCDGYVQPLK